jgi:tubulin-like protein CetZ
MVAKNQIIVDEIKQQNIINDIEVTDKDEIKKQIISDIEVTDQEELVNKMTNNDSIEQDKLAALRAKMAEKTGDNMPPRIIEKRKRSINVGVIGSGQCGSRLAEAFYDLGYDAVAINTAMQDLENIKIPEENKLFLNWGLGGAGKELEIGREAAESHLESINEIISSKTGNCDVFLFCTSLGGGTGAGSSETIINILSTFGKPIAVMTVLPMSTEDAQTKNNSLQTLAKLVNLAKSKVINNLIVVDNAKIETIYTDVGQLDFFNVSNKAIVEPLDIFNTLSSTSSSVKSLDPTEFSKLLIDGEGLTVYGAMTVANYTEDTAIAESVINNLNSNLLSAGFNLKQSRYVGVMIIASKKVWDKVPASSVNYAMSLINDLCGTPKGVFKGIYTVDSDDDFVKVYSMFSGLSLPEDRVEQLKRDVKESQQSNKTKDENRSMSLKLDTGVEESVSQADRIRQKIAAKSSAFGKLTKNVIDRRK